MRKLIYGDCFPRLLQNMRQYPGRWAARLVFLSGPWLSFWMVEILNGNDVFNDLYAWQVLMNLIWYYLLFFLCRLILGRNQWASTAGALLSFAFGLVNHYVLRFRGRSWRQIRRRLIENTRSRNKNDSGRQKTKEVFRRPFFYGK